MLRPRPLLLGPNKIQRSSNCQRLFKNWNFHQTQLPGYATKERYGRFYWRQNQSFRSKNAPKLLAAAGAPPRPH